jgi:phytoene synthase
MAVLRGERRRALWAVYAFCRAVDDIADGATPEAEKRRFLRDWRGKLARPDCALSRELAWAREAHGVPLAECEAMIAGMETDAADRCAWPTSGAGPLLPARRGQRRRHVGAGVRRAGGGGFGLDLGRTLQLTNILRDVDEDAARERVYVPLDMLAAAGIPDGPAAGIVAHPRFAAICETLARRAEAGFAAAEAELPGTTPGRCCRRG